MAHIRQSRPDSGLGLLVQVLKSFQVVPSSLGSGSCARGTFALSLSFLRVERASESRREREREREKKIERERDR